MNMKVLVAVVVGFLICHFHYKKKYSLLDNEIDSKMNKIKKNIEDFLKQEGVVMQELNAKKVANDIVNADSIKKVEILGFGGNSQDLIIN